LDTGSDTDSAAESRLDGSNSFCRIGSRTRYSCGEQKNQKAYHR